ncbi:2-amino-4-hydroxy-6-hydroxymethyldihydropteridine diphosphokinase [Isoptericola aurantiacus]|uniref:2-amino-4-hydroxy-6- hydroxymethyldihydropteridine diphosphokinase n=1 Tax=Isoptericola aurantiacus TaxID=3377839 RepID=UPI00383B6C7B
MTYADAVPGPDGRALDQIRLSGVTATGFHGVLPQERAEGQTFRADVVLHLDTQAAAASDDLTATVSYAEIADDVHAVLAGPPADLVERVAERIAAVVLERPAVQAVDVRVHKPQAPIGVPFDDVEVVVRRDRERMPVVPAVPAATGPVAAAVPPPPAPDEAAAAPATPSAAAVEPTPSAPSDPTAQVAEAYAGAADDDAPGAPEAAADPLDVSPQHPVDAVLALGANIGDPQGTLRAAVTDIDRIPGLQVMEVSPLARTAAVGPDQPDYLNAVLLVRTTLPPRDLLGACQEVELLHGRVREERWGPRTLDVDLVQYGDLVASSDDLDLPHPRAGERAFVLVPWAEVDPGAVLVGLGGGPVGQLAATAPDRSGIRWLALDWLTEPATTGAVPAQAEAPPSAPVPEAPAAPQQPPAPQQPLAPQQVPSAPDAAAPAPPSVPPTGGEPPAPAAPPSIPVPQQDPARPEGTAGHVPQAAPTYQPEQTAFAEPEVPAYRPEQTAYSSPPEASAYQPEQTAFAEPEAPAYRPEQTAYSSPPEAGAYQPEQTAFPEPEAPASGAVPASAQERQEPPPYVPEARQPATAATPPLAQRPSVAPEPPAWAEPMIPSAYAAPPSSAEHATVPAPHPHPPIPPAPDAEPPGRP